MKRALLLALLFVLVLGACGPTSSPTTIEIAVPQALVGCAQPPADDDLQARLWISGTEAPCPLTIDDDGVRGDCVVVPGIERVFTLDWFLVDSGGTSSARDIVLAQARKTIDLGGASDDALALEFADADYVTDDCLDMSVDSFAGKGTVDVDGDARPVCDLDDDGTANLVQLCAGRDPLGRL